MEQRKSLQINLFVEEVNRRRLGMKADYTLSISRPWRSFQKKRFLQGGKKYEYSQLEEMNIRLSLTYDGIDQITDEKLFGAELKPFSDSQ